MLCPHCGGVLPGATIRKQAGEKLGDHTIPNIVLAEEQGVSREWIRQLRAEDFPDMRFARRHRSTLLANAEHDLWNVCLSAAEVADRHGLSKAAVWSWRNRYGIKRLSPIVILAGEDLGNSNIGHTELARKIGAIPRSVRQARKRCYPDTKFRDGRQGNTGRLKNR